MDKTIIGNGGKLPDTHIADLDFGIDKESLLKMWEMIQPKFNEELSKRFGKCVIYGTSPEEESNSEWFKDLFMNPEAFNTVPIEDVWNDETIRTEYTVTNSGTTSKIYFKPVNNKEQ